MDTGKLEAKWPPDRKSTIGASEFGIYKESVDGKRQGVTDRASGCLLVLSLMAATAVVVYFTFFDYTIPTAAQAASSAGPVMSYAKYVKDKDKNRPTTLPPPTPSQDGQQPPQPSPSSPSVGISERPENGTEPTAIAVARKVEDYRDKSTLPLAGALPRRMRLYAPSQRPVRGHRLSYDSTYWRPTGDAPLEYSEGMYGFGGGGGGGDAFGRRSDFPQLAAYRAPFPPKSVLDVMKYVTGRPPRAAARDGPTPAEPMVAQESVNRYAPVRPVDINRFLADAAVAPKKPGSKRFRNQFGPPVYLHPPAMSLPDDFMKPPTMDAHYSMGFEPVVHVAHTDPAVVPNNLMVMQNYPALVQNSPPAVVQNKPPAFVHNNHPAVVHLHTTVMPANPVVSQNPGVVHSPGGIVYDRGIVRGHGVTQGHGFAPNPTAPHEGSTSVPSYTDVVFHSSTANGNAADGGVSDVGGYSVPVAPGPKRTKKKKNPKNKKPISVMLDIYPLSDRELERENEQVEEDEEDHSEIFESLKNNHKHTESDNLLYRLNLFPKFDEGSRRMFKSKRKITQTPMVHLTTSNSPLEDIGSDDEDEENEENENLYDYEYMSESKNSANISKSQSKSHKT